MKDSNIIENSPLLPCPFCGSSAKFETNRNEDSEYDGATRVKCNGCWVSSRYCKMEKGNDKELAARDWNRRHSPASPPAPDVVEAANDVLDWARRNIPWPLAMFKLEKAIAALSQPKEGEKDLTASPLKPEAGIKPHPGKPGRFICSGCSVDVFPPDYVCPNLRCKLKSENWSDSEPPKEVQVTNSDSKLAPVGPAPLTWTKEKPTKEGWYFHRHPVYNKKAHPSFISLNEKRLPEWFDGAEWREVEDSGREWAGPIPEPQDKAPNTEKPDAN